MKNLNLNRTIGFIVLAIVYILPPILGWKNISDNATWQNVLAVIFALGSLLVGWRGLQAPSGSNTQRYMYGWMLCCAIAIYCAFVHPLYG